MSSTGIRTVYICEACGVIAEEADSEPLYECSACGAILSRPDSADGASNRCPDCNRWGRRISDLTCSACGEGPVREAEGRWCDDCREHHTLDDDCREAAAAAPAGLRPGSIWAPVAGGDPRYVTVKAAGGDKVRYVQHFANGRTEPGEIARKDFLAIYRPLISPMTVRVGYFAPIPGSPAHAVVVRVHPDGRTEKRQFILSTDPTQARREAENLAFAEAGPLVVMLEDQEGQAR